MTANARPAGPPAPAATEARRQTGYSRLRDLIRADIVQGRLEPGSRLKIAELADRYATSAIPVREALQQLQGEGIVHFEANRGARVRVIDTGFVRDIHEIRALVEPLLMRWFVHHHSAADLDALVELQRQYDTLVEVGAYHQTLAANRAFHAQCYDRHYNKEAILLAYRHNDLISALSDRYPKSRARAQAVIREHWAIIDAIRRKDEKAAARITMEHVRSAGQHLIECMEASERPGVARRRVVGPTPAHSAGEVRLGQATDAQPVDHEQAP